MRKKKEYRYLHDQCKNKWKKKKEYRYLQIFSSVRINEQKQKNTEYIIYI